VQPAVVLEDIRQQVAAGAGHVTFGDPDFFNGPTHARRIVEWLHREFPDISYDVTIKIEHLLKHPDLLPVLRDTNCAFVTSAVESVDDRVLKLLEKGHTRSGFHAVVSLFRALGLTLNPTFIAFTPWTTRESYQNLLAEVRHLELIDQTSPIQLVLRLLIPSSSRMLELAEVRALTGPFDPVSLVHPWRHPDLAIDQLSRDALHLVNEEQKAGSSRRFIFAKLWQLANGGAALENFDLMPRATVPYLDEPWYC